MRCHIHCIGIVFPHCVQVNLDMTDSMGPGNLVRHMQNPSYTCDEYLICIGLGPSISSVICKICHMHMTDSVCHMQVCMLLHWGPHLMGIKVKTAKEYAWLDFYVFVCYANYQTVQTECCPAERNSAHVLVLAGISRLQDTCLSGIHNTNYIVKSIQYTYLICMGLGLSILSVIAKSLAYSGPS